MKKKDLDFKVYRINFADGQFYKFRASCDVEAKMKVQKYLIEFESLYTLYNGTHVKLYRILNDEIHSFRMEFVSKVYPFRRKYLKAVNLWSGKKTLVPVSSRHLVISCAYCCYFMDDNAPICSYCHGCLDCRDSYSSPKLEILTFSQLLDRFYNYEVLSF